MVPEEIMPQLTRRRRVLARFAALHETMVRTRR